MSGVVGLKVRPPGDSKSIACIMCYSCHLLVNALAAKHVTLYHEVIDATKLRTFILYLGTVEFLE